MVLKILRVSESCLETATRPAPYSFLFEPKLYIVLNPSINMETSSSHGQGHYLGSRVGILCLFHFCD